MRTISGTAAAASSVLTVTRTSCEPAWASRATWIAVPSASAVSVLVIDWTTTGWAEPDEHAADIDADRRPASRAQRVRGAHEGQDPAAQAADDVVARDPDQEGEQEHEADHVRQLLGAQAHAVTEEALERDHQHPPAIERRERQDVDDRQVGRQHARDIQREDRPELPEDITELGGDPDRAGDRWRFGRAVDDRIRRGCRARRR